MFPALSLDPGPSAPPARVPLAFEPRRPGRSRRLADSLGTIEACRLALRIASIFFDVAVEEIERPSRAEAPVCRARHVAIYLAHVAFQVKLIDVARAFGRDRSSVAHAVRRIEDERDDPALDDLLTRLERLAMAVSTLREGVR